MILSMIFLLYSIKETGNAHAAASAADDITGGGTFTVRIQAALSFPGHCCQPQAQKHPVLQTLHGLRNGV